MYNTDKALVVIDYQKDFVDMKEGRLPIAGADALEECILFYINKAINDGWGNLIFTVDTHNEETYDMTLEGQRLPVLHCPCHFTADYNVVADDAGAFFYSKLGEFIKALVVNYAGDKVDLDQLNNLNFSYMDSVLKHGPSSESHRKMVFGNGECGVSSKENWARNVRILTKLTFGCMDLKDAIVGEPKEIYVCGVVTNICVISNIVILRALFPNSKIIMIKDACAATDTENQENVIKLLSSIQVDVI